MREKLDTHAVVPTKQSSQRSMIILIGSAASRMHTILAGCCSPSHQYGMLQTISFSIEKSFGTIAALEARARTSVGSLNDHACSATT